MTGIKKNQPSTFSKVIGPLTGVSLLLLLMLFQGGFFASGQIHQGLATPASETVGETIQIVYSSRPDFYRAIGSVISRNQIDLMPRIVARILEIRVRSGDVVKTGDVLATLDAKDLAAVVSQGQQQLRAVRASVSAAEEQEKAARAALNMASQEMNRTRALFERNAAAKRDFDQAVNQLKQAEAGVQQAVQQKLAATANYAAAEQGIKQAEAGLSYATIISPIDAVVAERLADPGDLGNPASVILRLFDPDSLMLEVPVRESLVSEITLGSVVEYDVPALGRSFDGEVREIVPSVDPRTRTFIVKTCIDEAHGLMPGMFGTIRVPLKTKKNLILVPESAIIRTGQLESVVEILDGKSMRRQIRSVAAKDGMREVVSGLEPGQVILKNGLNRG